MSTSGIFCMACGTRIATINKGGGIRPLPGTVIERLYRLYAVARCQCGCERKIRYPEDQKAA